MFKALCVTLLFGTVFVVQGKIYKIPEHFKLGVATSAYQVEGGWNANGKGQNIWDNLTHSRPDYSPDHSNGDIACDSYHKWKEDVKLLKEIGVNHYRFSISWSRILPTGFTNEINPDGIKYYNNLINELIKNDIVPLVTIFHFDLPQPLQDLGGLANEKIATYVEDYARILFENFGDRVKWWLTFNEPYTYCGNGYFGIFAPLVDSNAIGTYLCGKTLLVGHGKIYRMYEKLFKDKQKGHIGITVNSYWFEPKTDSKEDRDSRNRILEFTFGWWMNPIYTKEGNYPQVMIDRVGNYSKAQNFSESRLPVLTEEEIKNIRGSFDFFGLNYYTSKLSEADHAPPHNPPTVNQDAGAILSYIPNAEHSGAEWLRVYPKGIKSLLLYIKEKYNNPPIIITENGYPDNDGRLCDLQRIKFIQNHLIEIMKAMEEGCNVHGYTYWGFMDDYEWNSGYTLKFGIVRVDFNSPNRTRTQKASAQYFKNLIKYKMLSTDPISSKNVTQCD